MGKRTDIEIENYFEVPQGLSTQMKGIMVEVNAAGLSQMVRNGYTQV